MVFEKSACIEPMYQELPFLERFRAAGQDGFAYVEFWSWTDKDLRAVRQAAEDAGVGIAGFNGDAELSLIDPRQKEAYFGAALLQPRRWEPARSPSIPTDWEKAAWCSTAIRSSATR